MNSIFSLWSAIANFTRSLNRLAAVADAVADEAERRVEVIGHTPAAPIALSSADGPELVTANGHAEPVKASRRK